MLPSQFGKSTPLSVVILVLGFCLNGWAQKPVLTKPTLYATAGKVTLNWRKSSERDIDYINATMSFEYATKTDVKHVLNDWDLYLQGQGTKRSPYLLIARTVTDDTSDIWHLGVQPFEKVTKKSVKLPNAKRAIPNPKIFGSNGFPPIVGHTYVIHTKDVNSDFWVKFKVDAVRAKDSVSISWELLTTPKRQLDIDRAKRAEQIRKNRAIDRKKRRRRSR